MSGSMDPINQLPHMDSPLDDSENRFSQNVDCQQRFSQNSEGQLRYSNPIDDQNGYPPKTYEDPNQRYSQGSSDQNGYAQVNGNGVQRYSQGSNEEQRFSNPIEIEEEQRYSNPPIIDVDPIDVVPEGFDDQPPRYSNPINEEQQQYANDQYAMDDQPQYQEEQRYSNPIAEQRYEDDTQPQRYSNPIPDQEQYADNQRYSNPPVIDPTMYPDASEQRYSNTPVDPNQYPDAQQQQRYSNPPVIDQYPDATQQQQRYSNPPELEEPQYPDATVQQRYSNPPVAPTPYSDATQQLRYSNTPADDAHQYPDADVVMQQPQQPQRYSRTSPEMDGTTAAASAQPHTATHVGDTDEVANDNFSDTSIPPPPPPVVDLPPVASEESVDITEAEQLRHEEEMEQQQQQQQQQMQQQQHSNSNGGSMQEMQALPGGGPKEGSPPGAARSDKDGKSDGCCDSLLKCLGLIPCPTLLSWILLLLGIGCFTGSLLIATWRTRDLLDNDALLWFMEYAVIGVVSGMFVFGCMFLIFGHLSSEPNSRRVFNSTSKNKCAQGMNVFAVVLAFFLTVVWVLLTSVLSTPLVFIINFFIVEPDPLNLAVYGLSNATFSGLALEEFKGDTKDLLITYGVAFFGCIMVIISLIGFIISMSSNIAHLKDQRFATLNAYGENDVRNSKHSVVDTTM